MRAFFSLFLLPVSILTISPAQANEDIDLVGSSKVDFTAIVALSNCSGALVRFATSLETDPAMVLTNAHCVEGHEPQPGEAFLNVPSSRSFDLLSSKGTSVLATFQADRILYTTETDTDLALYRLTTTFKEIEQKHHVKPLTLSSQRSSAGRKIAIASGFWKKIYNCAIDTFVHELQEAGWIWRDSIRYSQPGCNVAHGTSGSPIIDVETLEVVGINNTGNDDGEKCTMNNPCEVDASGHVTAIKGASYGQQIHLLYTCLNAQNQFDMSKPGCAMTQPKP